VRDQPQRCGAVPLGLRPPRLTGMPQRALRQAAAWSFARKGWMRSAEVSHPYTYCSAMWRRGHKKKDAAGQPDVRILECAGMRRIGYELMSDLAATVQCSRSYSEPAKMDYRQLCERIRAK